MPKKRKQSYDDFDDEQDFVEDELNPLDGAPMDLVEGDVLDICGKPNAARGSLLFASGAVSQRSFDGKAIHATVNDSGTLLPVVFDLTDYASACSAVDHARTQNPTCEHIAALLYAYARETESFLPQTIGEFIKIIQQNPTLREQAGATDPQVAAILDTLQNAPPEVRAVFDQLPVNATPDDMARLAPQMQMLAQAQTKVELQSLLELFTPDQLRAIAQRRQWKLDSTAKAQIVTQLAAQLEAAPLPAGFSPEEEQFLRIVNTLDGITRDPDRGWLERIWKKRAGGDFRRLDLAVSGLQSAGMLFACRHDGTRLHYHWSPFVESEDLPLLAPKIKLYPAEKIEYVQIVEPSLPLVSLVDTVIAFAEHEPLRMRAKSRDGKLAQSPYVREWDYDPKEVEPLLKTGYLYTGVLTIPLLPLWTDETLDTLETFASGSRDLGIFAAGLALTLGIVKDTGDGRAAVESEKINIWSGLSFEEQQTALWDLWRGGAVGYGELRMAAACASLLVQRSIHEQIFTQQTLIQEIGYARQFVTRLLAPLNPLTWYSWKSFAEFARDLRPDFLHTFTNPNTWFLLAAKTQQRYQANNPAHWDAAYRPILAAMLEGALRWLGAVELAYENNALVAFQITPVGAWLLSGGKTGSATTTARQVSGDDAIRWLDDSTCRLRASPDAARLMPLVRAFANPTRELLTFRVSNATIARAFARGIAANEIAEKFAQVGAPLPTALRERMDALYANYGRVHLYEQLTVLELADEFALRELLASTSLGKYVVHQFSPRVVILRDEGVEELVTEMVKKGYTPKVTSGV